MFRAPVLQESEPLPHFKPFAAWNRLSSRIPPFIFQWPLTSFPVSVEEKPVSWQVAATLLHVGQKDTFWSYMNRPHSLAVRVQRFLSATFLWKPYLESKTGNYPTWIINLLISSTVTQNLLAASPINSLLLSSDGQPCFGSFSVVPYSFHFQTMNYNGSPWYVQNEIHFVIPRHLHSILLFSNVLQQSCSCIHTKIRLHRSCLCIIFRVSKGS